MKDIQKMLNTVIKNTDNKPMSLNEFLELCKNDPSVYLTPSQRMYKAIGDPVLVDTSKDPRLSRIYSNRVIRQWECFNDFYGIDQTIEKIVDYFKHASQGLEESKQILYLLGPVGGAKSSLAARLREIFETQPFYAIDGSPINDHPFALIQDAKLKQVVSKEYNIPIEKLSIAPSPWLTKRLRESSGNIDWIKIVKRYPSFYDQVASARTEPGDENNQDISTLVGKLDIRKLEKFSPNDTDAYSYSGGLCLANRGILEFVEMFKAPIKVLHPLLTATQDKIYTGTESIPVIPFEGIVISHSNVTEWESFKNDNKNEAFIDRVYIVKVPYSLRLDEETKVYKKMLNTSSLSQAPCAPKTLEILATFSVLSRLVEPTGKEYYIKARIYNGENVKNEVNMPKSAQELRDAAGVDEGMSGISTRFSFKVLSKVFNYDPEEVAANPVHLLHILKESIQQENLPKDTEEKLLNFISGYLKKIYHDFLFEEIQTAYIDSYSEYGQNIFDRYITYAEAWIDDNDYRDHSTGLLMSTESLNKELSELEDATGVVNRSDFRHDVVTFCNRVRAKTGGQNPKWTDYEKMSNVIKKKLFLNNDEILPIISFSVKKSDIDEKKHQGFVSRMCSLGYTQKQVRLLTEYYLQYRHSQN